MNWIGRKTEGKGMGATTSKHLTVFGDTFLIGPETIGARPPGGDERYGQFRRVFYCRRGARKAL